jgi:hypothetical protein
MWCLETSNTNIEIIGGLTPHNVTIINQTGSVLLVSKGKRNIDVSLIQEVTASTTDGNLTGTFNITWYDNTIDIIVIANQALNFNGASEEQVAGNTFDIDLSAGGEYGYAFL